MEKIKDNITLIEANILTIHPHETVLKYFNNNTDMLNLLKYYIKFPVHASFRFADKTHVCEINAIFNCGYVADIVVPNIHYCNNISEIRQHFQFMFWRNDENSKRFLEENLDIHAWAWSEKVYYTMHSKRKIFREEIWDDAGCSSQTLCIFDFRENPSINFANFIKRAFVGLIYGIYKYGVSKYESYLLPPLSALYTELCEDETISDKIKNLVEEDLIYV